MLKSARVVPDAYEGNSVNVALDQHPSQDPDSVPVVNLNDPNAWGAFQLTYHGIPQSLVHDMESAARSLFSLPAHQKLKAARSPGQMSGYGFHLIAAFWDKQHIEKICITEEFEKEIKRLASRLMWLMLTLLRISKDNVVQKLNSYLSCPDPDRALDLVPHTDSNLGTGWFAILVVYVGDLMSILSNGSYSTVKIAPLPQPVGPSHPPLHRPVTNWNEYIDTKAKLKDKALPSLRLYDPLMK
ncbi:gibberellin 3-beta-dioxygenase 1-like [Pyrus ussuriensis x Pyrus communis]|uniref:Gibberellin 3-beta-dioxygenase 1-like n=1 Tax=Pyrus ussuriensis x Pyrus communis TaxID=2448454 RepID=A0A5N5I325_9ROSA|nr:gibberellin 3-beta-dioxygenase 1-like [Pyrus ussuriensis x Pyrus communis]